MSQHVVPRINPVFLMDSHHCRTCDGPTIRQTTENAVHFVCCLPSFFLFIYLRLFLKLPLLRSQNQINVVQQTKTVFFWGKVEIAPNLSKLRNSFLAIPGLLACTPPFVRIYSPTPPPPPHLVS